MGIVLFNLPDGTELLAHCPDEYNRIEIEETATGNRLTASQARTLDDFFHSNLAVSPDGRRILSAGWIWHPVNSCSAWLIEEALADPSVLDHQSPPGTVVKLEIDDAAFLDNDRLLIASNPKASRYGEPPNPDEPGTLAIFNLRTNTIERSLAIHEPLGPMLPLGQSHIVGFYNSPRIIDLTTGAEVLRFPDLPTSQRTGSITHHIDPIPPIALDRIHHRFAVAAPDRITVIQFSH